ncbi:MAG TPA: polyphosphate kinase 1, partial [Rhodothermales bacterium]|nr:polyphosphate kinase 1 [Rhodothermales bacterium]
RDGGINFSTTETHYALVKVPSPPLQRFVQVPGDDEHEHEHEHYVLFLDDLIRHFLPDLFPAYEVGKAYAIKLSRDADLYLEDEFSGNLKEMIEKSLSKRKTGTPTRFLYDQRMPKSTLTFIEERLDIAEEDVIEGWRYHNLNDFFSFPRFGKDDLTYEAMPPLPHPELDALPSIMASIREHDRLLHFPYQSFDYVIRFLEEAAEDPDVEGLWITLYRIADDSAVAKALVRAAEQGKQVTAFVEAKARFDEATNLRWAERMEDAGVNVLYSMPGIKVHTKLALVARREDDECCYYAYLGTGNFNEKTARVYSDLALLTADQRLGEEVRKVFAFLDKENEEPTFEHVLMAPLYLRDEFNRLIDREIENAEAGKDAWILAKMNSLEDPRIIERLYKANQAGVDVRMLVRGFSCLVPGVEGVSEDITITSIVDRFLEHARAYVFCNDGEEDLYLASADWMKRNLNRRVEVAFPIYDPALAREIRTLLDFQLNDNVRARLFDEQQTNPFVENDDEPVRSQFATYEHFKDKVEHTVEASG